MPNPNGVGGWQKGRSGNPRGRPPAGESPTTLLRQALAVPYQAGSDLTKLQFLITKAVEGLVRDAERGELPLSALLPVFARLDGSPPLGLPIEEARERLVKLDALRETSTRGADRSRSMAALKALGQI
jgi:hypothetical protein